MDLQGSGVDNKATFEALLHKLALPQEAKDALLANGITTVAGLAFSTSYQPGRTDETPFLELSKKILGEQATIGAISTFRRLYFLCHTQCVADMKAEVERREGEPPLQMPLAERTERHETQKRRLVGVDCEGQNEPSHSLLDKVMAQRRENILRYIPPEECTNRPSEVKGAKKARTLQFDNAGYIKVQDEDPNEKVSVSTSWDLHQAWLRRALAYDQAGLISFRVHQLWTSKLMQVLSKPTISGYMQISHLQVLNADKELWQQMGTQTRGGIQGKPGEDLPLDLAMQQLMSCSEVSFHLLPLQVSSKSATAPTSASTTTSAQGARPAKGKGKTGTRPRTITRPPQGVIPRTEDGKNICFGYNDKGGCPLPVKEGRCVKGFHICGRKGCHGPHPIHQCSKAS